MAMCVYVSQIRHYTCREKRLTTYPPKLHTKSIRNQISIFKYQIHNKNTQSKRYMTRYVTHIEKETKPIPLLEDWWRGIENMKICVWTLWFRKRFRQGTQWIVTNKSRENSKSFLKKLTIKCKTRIFRDWVKSQASRRGQLPEHSRQK